MQYINPLALLGLDPEEALQGISSARLKREKKKLMAEFELKDASNIELRGISLNKNQVLDLFDQTFGVFHLCGQLISKPETRSRENGRRAQGCGNNVEDGPRESGEEKPSRQRCNRSPRQGERHDHHIDRDESEHCDQIVCIAKGDQGLTVLLQR